MNADSHLLMRYHRQGDALAFQRLVEVHAGMVHATANRITHDAALAQDIAQETFLALARSSGAAIKSVGAWLHHVAWQKACDQVRATSCRQRHEAAAAEYLHQDSEDATWAEVEPLLDEALEELPAQARELLIERFLVGRTQQELADRAGLSQSTVSRLINHAIGDLRTLLKAKGVACGSGLAVLLSTRGLVAAPPALLAALGKVTLSSIGAATSTLTLTSLLMKTVASKLTLAAAAALLLAGTVAYDLGSSDPWLLSAFRKTASTPSKAVTTSSETRPPARALPFTKAPASEAPVIGRPEAQAANSDSPEVRLAKLARMTKEADFKTLLLKLFATGDPRHISSELQRLMGIDLSEKEVAFRMQNPGVLEVAIFEKMAQRHPRETLAWMAMLDGNNRLMTMTVYPQIFQHHPEITAESVAASLPAGPNREEVLSLLRAQEDTVTEAQNVLTTVMDPKARMDRLWKLADLWPARRTDEAVKWALQNLSGYDLKTFLPRVAHHLSTTSPDAALAMLSQIRDPSVLSTALGESCHGLVQKHSRMSEVVPLLDKLQGQNRANAITMLSSMWVRVDQEGLMRWINNLESPADFEAALPFTLMQLTPENYAKVIDTLMPQLDGTLDTALIRAAMPYSTGAIRTTTDIIHRLTQLPQYSSIGAGQQGNQDLLWQAVKRAAAGWVTMHGAKAPQGAQWIDSLPFRTPADKAAVAAQLYTQWKISDPTAATAWARQAGVQVP